MIRDYFKIAIRNIVKNKLNSIINIGGLVLGITCFLVIFIWVRFQLSFDSYHEKGENIVRVIYKQSYKNQFIHSAVSPSPLGPALKSEFPEVTNYSRYSIFFGEVLLSYNDRKFYENKGAYADPEFLDMFSIEVIKGDKNNALSSPYSIILTESMAAKYFGNEDPINKIIYLEGSAQLMVKAVITDIPKNSHLQFNFIVPYILFEKWGTNLEDWNNWAHQYNYLQLKENANIEVFENRIRNYLDKYNSRIKGELYLQRLKGIHLNTSLNYDNYSNLQEPLVVKLFIIIGFVVLAIVCLNFMNLTAAQYLGRMKEAGIRKIIGAKRSNLVSRYILESLIIASVSIYLSLIIVEILCKKIDLLNQYQLKFDFTGPTITVVTSLLIVIGFISGLFPALFLAFQNPAQVLKGKMEKHKGVLSIRRLIIFFQFILASGLVIISIYGNKQIKFIKNKQLGYNPEDVIAIQLRGNMNEKYNTFKQELLKHEFIKYVSYGSSLNTINSSTTEGLVWKGKKENDSFEVFLSSIDFDYLEMMNIQVLYGRSFSEDYITDANEAFILNEAAVKKLGLEEPVGESISFMGTQGQVIGVVKDFHFSSFFEQIEPLIISIRKDWRFYLFIKVEKPNKSRALDYIESVWNNINPEFPLSYKYISDEVNQSYDQFRSSIDLILNFTIIAILIALTGLNALTSYIAKSRTKEIGIRKALGALNRSILIQQNWDFIKLIVISYIISIPITILILRKWMQIFAYKQEITVEMIIISGLVIVALSIITINGHILTLIRKNPTESLRYE